MALKHVKNKIIATQKTGKVTKAMEAVSAVKMRKSQQRALSGRPYADAAFRILENISRSNDAQVHPLLQVGVGTHVCVIVITSDKGLAGSLNSAVLKEVDTLIATHKNDAIEVIAFGRKALEYFKSRGYATPLHLTSVSDDVRVDDVQHVAQFILDAFSRGHYHTVHLVFQNFISTFEQRPRTYQVLPINPNEVRKLIHDIAPREGKYSDTEKVNRPVVYTTEQSSIELLDALFATIVEIMIYHALLEHKASEHSARMVAMKNATDKSKEIVRALTLLFNKERQAMITAEVSEITGGIEAMKH